MDSFSDHYMLKYADAELTVFFVQPLLIAFDLILCQVMGTHEDYDG